jgi:hypothetical protein
LPFFLWFATQSQHIPFLTQSAVHGQVAKFLALFGQFASNVNPEKLLKG